MSEHPIYEAAEPRAHDRRLYPWVLLAAAVIIVLVVAFVVWRVAFDTTDMSTGGARFDFRSVFYDVHGFPDPANPCMVLQDHLEATRLEEYRLAYGYLAPGLQAEVPYDAFVRNCKENRVLLEDVDRYACKTYTVDGTSAAAKGSIFYGKGGKSEIEAVFASEDGRWRITRLTVIFK